MANTKERVRPVKTLKYLILGVILCAAVGAACFLLGRSASPENTRIDAVVIENQLAQISELSTVSYRYTNMAQFENSSDFYGVTIPFTTKRFILTYDGEIKAGTDLSQASVTVSGSRVTVRLAAAQILEQYLLLKILAAADEEEVVVRRAEAVTDAAAVDNRVNPPPLHALAHTDDVTAVAVEVQHIGIEMTDFQFHARHLIPRNP